MVRAVLYCTFPLKVEYLYLWEMTVLFSKDREIHYLHSSATALQRVSVLLVGPRVGEESDRPAPTACAARASTLAYY